MTQSQNAPITTLFLCAQALAQAMGRDGRLPGLAVFYGPAGSGKTLAAKQASETLNALYIQAWPVWTQRALLEALATPLNITLKARTVTALLTQVIEALKADPRPLIIDEMDHVVKKGLVEIIRTLHDTTGVPILLVGEEALPARLKIWDRFHSRILSFTPTVPANLDDARHLAQAYVDGLQVDDDLLDYFLSISKGLSLIHI